MPDWHNLAQNVLAPTEIAMIARQEEAERSTAFLRCFTAREAYLKAVGTGFSAPTAALDFHNSRTMMQTANGRICLYAPLPPLPDFVGHCCLINAP